MEVDVRGQWRSQCGKWWWEQCPPQWCLIFHFKSMVHNFGWGPWGDFQNNPGQGLPQTNKSSSPNFLKESLLIVSDIFQNFKVNKVEQISPNPFRGPLPLIKQWTQVSKTAMSSQRGKQVPSSFCAPLPRHTFCGLSGSESIKAALWGQVEIGRPGLGTGVEGHFLRLLRVLSSPWRVPPHSQGLSALASYPGVILTTSYAILHILDRQKKHNIMKLSAGFLSFSSKYN